MHTNVLSYSFFTVSHEESDADNVFDTNRQNMGRAEMKPLAVGANSSTSRM